MKNENSVKESSTWPLKLARTTPVTCIVCRKHCQSSDIFHIIRLARNTKYAAEEATATKLDSKWMLVKSLSAYIATLKDKKASHLCSWKLLQQRFEIKLSHLPLSQSANVFTQDTMLLKLCTMFSEKKASSDLKASADKFQNNYSDVSNDFCFLFCFVCFVFKTFVLFSCLFDSKVQSFKGGDRNSAKQFELILSYQDQKCS